MLTHILQEHRVNKVLLSCIGCWPFQNEPARRVLSTFCIILVASYMPLEIFTLCKHRGDGQMFFECCYQIVISIAFLVKLLNQFWNRDKFRRMYEIMEDHWIVLKEDVEIRTLKHYALISRKFTIFYMIVTYGTALMFTTLPVLLPIILDAVLPLNESRPWNIPMYAEYGVDQEKHFMPIFCYTAAVIIMGMTIMIASDTMHVVCTAHACSLFQVIGQQIENILSSADVSDEVDEYRCRTNKPGLFNERVVYREYIVYLKKHQHAIEFVDILNNTHKMVGIGFTFLIGTVFSLVGVRIVYVLDQVEELIRFLFIITGALLQLMILCYSGQKLMDQSQNIFHRAYFAEWYRFSPRLKSLLIITLHRSLVPCKLTAGNLFPLSMMIFATVVRTGVSYFTAFLSFKD